MVICGLRSSFVSLSGRVSVLTQAAAYVGFSPHNDSKIINNNMMMCTDTVVAVAAAVM